MTQRITPEVAAQVARLFADEAQAVSRSALRATWGDRAEAENLVQEAFQAAALGWDTIADYLPARKRAWLCRVAINKAIDGYRTGKRVQPTADPGDVASEQPSAEYVALTQIQADRCLKVISEMPEIRGKVAYLKFHEEWKNREIADHLGISAGAVGAHAHAARIELEEALGPEMTLNDDPDREADAGREEAL